jgi:peptidoglycan L-alanyl-D-glutamate endopeptidase CwlK
MPKFSKKSMDRLATCHDDIQKVMNEAIKEFDFTVLSGYRSPDEQFELYKQGRELIDGKWVKVGKTVTNVDGTNVLSNHNYNPSRAIDIAPYPIDWDNIDRFIAMSNVVLKCAKELDIELEWGGNWRMKDYPHFELKN